MPEDGTEPLAQESSHAAQGTKHKEFSKGHVLTVSDLVHQLSKTSTRTGSPWVFFSLRDLSVFKHCGLCHARWSRLSQCFLLALKSITPTVVWYPTAGNQMQHALTAYCS